MFSFLASLSLSKQEIQQGVKLLMEAYPEDVDLKLTDEFALPYIYVKKNHKPEEKSHLSHTDLYQIIYKENIQMAFPNVEAILRLFLTLMVTNCSGKGLFQVLKE